MWRFALGVIFGAACAIFLDPNNAKVVLSHPPTDDYTSWACYLSIADNEMRCADLDTVFHKIADELEKGTETI